MRRCKEVCVCVCVCVCVVHKSHHRVCKGTIVGMQVLLVREKHEVNPLLQSSHTCTIVMHSGGISEGARSPLTLRTGDGRPSGMGIRRGGVTPAFAIANTPSTLLSNITARTTLAVTTVVQPRQPWALGTVCRCDACFDQADSETVPLRRVPGSIVCRRRFLCLITPHTRTNTHAHSCCVRPEWLSGRAHPFATKSVTQQCGLSPPRPIRLVSWVRCVRLNELGQGSEDDMPVVTGFE